MQKNPTMMQKKTLLLVLFLATVLAKSLAQDSLKAPAILHLPRWQGSFLLDGLSNEAHWQNVPSLPFFVLEPVWGQAASEKTELKIAYDDRYLYVAGRNYERDPSKIVSRNLVRDGWRGDDWCTLHLDTRFDRQNALVFSMYPLGSRYDMSVSNDAVELGNSTFNSSFNMIWEGKAAQNQEGWFYEMRIPLDNLRFKPDSLGDVHMAISSTRTIQHRQEFHQFPRVPQNAIDPIMKPSLKQEVVLSGLKQPRLLWITPYALGGYQRNSALNSSETAYEMTFERSAQVGFDLKYGLSPQLTLDLSVNPDFAQVEADNQQVNLTRFSVFFPERRLFFQEQAGLFEFNLGGSAQLFYSRRIGINDGQLSPILGGVRITGKLHPTLDLGVLNMQTARSTLDDGQKVASENFSILRLRQRVFNPRSFIGTMFTSRISADRQNFAVGTDGLINIKGDQYLFFGLANTFGQTQNQSTQLRLDASRAFASWELRRTDRWFYNLKYSYSGQNFQPEAGFVDRSNVHNIQTALRYGRFAKERKGVFQYQSYTALLSDIYFNARTGRLESLELGSGWRGNTFKGLRWFAHLAINNEYLVDSLDLGNGLVFQPGDYHFPSLWTSFTPPNFKDLFMSISLSGGRFYYGNRVSVGFSPTWNLGKHLALEAKYNLDYLHFPKRKDTRYIHLALLRVNYALDLHFSASFNLQYNSNVKQFLTNARLRYNFSDGHDLYLVYNENLWTELETESLTRPRSDGQTFLLKYSITLKPLRKSR